MRIAARTTSGSGMPRREQLMSERLRAATLRALFPQIEKLRIDLVFNDPNARSPPPSPQRHTLYSGAPAFFRFACPCADCDGDFDLTAAVTSLITNPPERGRADSLDGQLSCRGLRFRDHAVYQTSCAMQLSFQLQFEPLRAA